ncbi:hypothetical protein Ddye_019271 [Dipteronia dyeriana]|uniref:Plastid lipid-associated protein/fibrillin conserved domain-containing protein n=1 Tax=Dipteronia dyeriana TaxID=168575 RepID=A0AAD9TXX9_9ROSI|nr:hypothetical protein Ddye_019271 [Dipteronia dyeriana]
MTRDRNLRFGYCSIRIDREIDIDCRNWDSSGGRLDSFAGKCEFLGQKMNLTPFKGFVTSVQDTASCIAKTISNQLPLKFSISNSIVQSRLLTTYLDEDLWISRGDAGSVFVLIKEGSSLLTPLTRPNAPSFSGFRTLFDVVLLHGRVGFV